MEEYNNYLSELPTIDFDEKIFQTSISFNTLAVLIHRAVDVAVEKRFKELQENSKPEKDPLLTIEEVAGLFDVSIVTVHAWKKKGLLRGFKRVGARVYIKESDCMASMKEIKLHRRQA